MHWYNYVTIISSLIAMFGLASQRYWTLAGTSACLAAYTIFDKAVPTAIPTELTTVFPLMGLMLAITAIIRRFVGAT